MTSYLANRIRLLSLIVFIVVILPLNAQAGFPLPHYSDVPESEKMPIDGTWLITANKSRIRISKGRAYAIDSWKVFFATVEPEHVALRDIIYLGQGDFKGEDLSLSGKFSAKIQANGNLLFQAGMIVYALAPIELEQPIEYIGLMTQAGLDPENSPYLNNWVAAEKKKRAIEEEIEHSENTENSENTDLEFAMQAERYEDETADSDGGEALLEEPGLDEPLQEEPGLDEPGLEEPVTEAPPEDSFLIDDDPQEEEESTGEEMDEGSPQAPKPVKIKARLHGIIKTNKLSCSGNNVYFSNGACYGCPANYKRASLARKMNHPKACQKRGLAQYKYRKADYIGKAKPVRGCPGKNVYRSKGRCYTCPAGYKRASLTRKMNHPQACQQRGLPKHRYTKAKYLYKLKLEPLGCPAGQFSHKGYCKSCPTGSIRLHYLGLDTGYCLAKK